MDLTAIVERGWTALGAGDFDAVVSDYVEDMVLVMPGQADRLVGRTAFRAALGGLSELVPPGFAITGLRHLAGDDEVVSIVEWTADKVPASQLSILFRFRGDKIHEERWFIDTDQWRRAF